MTCCGVCGTDGHIHDGEFIAKFPLIPGHEAIGKVVEIGKNVKGFDIGDRCVAEVGITVSIIMLIRIHRLYFGYGQCGICFYCRRGSELMCENFHCVGVTTDGGFAEYVK